MFPNSGLDWISAQLFTNTSAGTRGCGFAALSENATAPAAGDTTVAGEITTNGLARKDVANKTHSAGTNVTVLDDSWTATGAFTAVQKVGYLTAISSGTLVIVKTFSSVALNSGDIIQVTLTITGP